MKPTESSGDILKAALAAKEPSGDILKAALAASSEIKPGVAYPVEALAERGFGKWALRQARRNGLIVRRIGRMSFVLGDDLLGYLVEHSKIVGPRGELK